MFKQINFALAFSFVFLITSSIFASDEVQLIDNETVLKPDEGFEELNESMLQEQVADKTYERLLNFPNKKFENPKKI